MKKTSINPNSSKLLLSREMSHFLLRLQNITEDEHLQGLKTLYFGRPFITPFIVFDEVLIDPSVGSFVDSLHPGVKENRFYRLLNKDNSVNYVQIDESVYHSCVTEAADLASRVISDPGYRFPEELQPDYLLETPLYLFFKESKPFVDLVLKLVRGNPNIGVEEIAFVFSACYSVILGQRTNVPVLTSRVGAKILDNICSRSEYLRPLDDMRSRIFDEMSGEMSHISRKVSFELPDFTEIESGQYSNLEELIRIAIDIRNDSGARLLRRKLSEITYLGRSQPDEKRILEMARDEIKSASEKLVESIRPTRAKRFRTFAVELVLTSPVILLTYGIGIPGLAAGIVSKILLDEVKAQIHQKKYGWFYFIFRNAPFTRLSLMDKD